MSLSDKIVSISDLTNANAYLALLTGKNKNLVLNNQPKK